MPLEPAARSAERLQQERGDRPAAPGPDPYSHPNPNSKPQPQLPPSHEPEPDPDPDPDPNPKPDPKPAPAPNPDPEPKQVIGQKLWQLQPFDDCGDGQGRRTLSHTFDRSP